jgi:glycerol kinase
MSGDKRYILAIDQGTTSTRALIFDECGEVVKLSQKELTLYTPQSGWVEQDVQDIWNDTVCVCNDVLAGFEGQISAIGITNQRETTIIWDKNTGKAVHNAIVWQDRRTVLECQQLKDEGREAQVIDISGLLLDPYFSASKIKWILAQNEQWREKAQNGELLFGTVETYLIWKLSSGQVHKTDISNASRTLLMDVEAGQWSEELCALFDVPKVMLPEICDNIHEFASVDCDEIAALSGVKVMGCAGDQQAALFGQACFEKGMIKSTYGTGCFALMNMGQEAKRSENKLLTSVAWRFDGQTTYALEGSIFVAGAAVQFLRDNLGLIEHANETQALAESLDDTDGVYFVPALTGLGAPYWYADARGAVMGLSRGTTKAHIVKATLDAQAYQTQDLLSAMAADSGATLTEMRVDGGLSANDYVVQKIADITGLQIRKPANQEATAWGAAAMAGIGVGVFAGTEDISELWQQKQSFSPALDESSKNIMYAQWRENVGRLL